MTPLEQARSKIPALAGLSDEQAIDVLQQTYYRDSTREDLAKAAGVTLSSPDAPGRTFGGTAKDIGISALKGAIAIPEAAVGLADMASGGRAGKSLEELGFRPKEAKAMLEEGYSDPQKEAFRRVQAAEGLGDTFMQAVQNPSVIGHSVVESLPLMGAGGVVARGGLAAASKIAPAMAAAPGAGIVAGAAGEGVVGAGSAAEQIRQQTQDGLLTGTQSALAGASGGATALFGFLGGRIAQKLGIADVDTMLAGAATNPALRKGVVRSALEGAFSEGFLEELPQSVSEQVLQNIALDKPLDEGIDQAIVLGLLSGATMGAGANVVSSLGGQPASGMPSPAVAPPPEPIVPAGPLTRAANRAAVTNLQAVQSEEMGMPDVAQTTPPDGAAILAYQQKLDQQRREAEIAAQRAEASPDDEIYASTGAAPPIMAAAGLPVAPAPKAAPAEDQTRSKAVVNEVPGPSGRFASAEEAQDYISQQRRAASITLPSALPVQNEDGTYGVATEGSPQFEEAQRQDKARRLLAAGVLEGDLLNSKGDLFAKKFGADQEAKRQTKSGNAVAVVPVTGGFVVRKTEQADAGAIPDVPAAATGDAAGRADAGAGVGSGTDVVPGPGADTAAAKPDAVGRDGEQPAGVAGGALTDQQKRAADVFKARVAAADDKTKPQVLAQWKEQAENPGRYHPVVEDENPKGLKIGDETNMGTVVSVQKTDAKTYPSGYIAKVVGKNSYGGWQDLGKVNKTKPDTPAMAAAPAPDAQQPDMFAAGQEPAAADPVAEKQPAPKEPEKAPEPDKPRDWKNATPDELSAEISRLSDVSRKAHKAQLKMDGDERAREIQKMDDADNQIRNLEKLMPDETAEAEQDEGPYQPEPDWRESMFGARTYASKLGIDPSGMELAGVVKAIDKKLKADAKPAENAAWAAMSQEERLALAMKSGMAKMIAGKIAPKAWADLTDKTRAKIEAAMAAPPAQTEPAAPAAAEPAAPAAEAAPEPERPVEVVELRKRLSVLKSLLKCMG